MPHAVTEHKKSGIMPLTLGAIGVVFGDIGTSPLYALKECFSGHHPLTADKDHILGVISLIFWLLMGIVSYKYVTIIMRADNRGEGGSLALLALVQRSTRNPILVTLFGILGIFAAGLFYGDSMITPAISVLSAVEGLELAAPSLSKFVIPITLFVLIGLFILQKHGTALIGALFGPVMAMWFTSLALLGILNIIKAPEILWALNPYHAFHFFVLDKWMAFLALGAVVLAVTGAEALYSDMGHFGRSPIRLAWFYLVLPALMLNYMGQGSVLLTNPEAIENPFYYSVPEWGLMPMVVLATLSAVIASQSVITGAYSLTKQAIQLGFLPRLTVVHTSGKEMGQIYIPFVNWLLLISIVGLVLGFGTSSKLAAAYGIAVTGTMLVSTLLILALMMLRWRWAPWKIAAFGAVFLTVDISLFSANATKITHGGWFPLAIGLVVFVMLTTWKRGRSLLSAKLRDEAMPLEDFLGSLSTRVNRVSGTAAFMTGQTAGVPHALLHNMKHNKILHERNLLLTVKVEEVAHVPAEQRLDVTDLGKGFYRVLIHYGFMDDPDVPAALSLGEKCALPIRLMDTSFFLSRETIIPKVGPGMMMWREALFAWMSRNAATAMDFFNLPTNRVVELGTQIEI
ncbi:potassium transporter Kup [Govanella unica]|uniref:Probable potassium transport system protein Kup n=1 Tax=Govanella unica TaxID=2975056 RepID=A0A9X3Z7S0_9PROT|nr:potassium transporter Kup [Govania unica]MDA5194284.1 potassium transporter Kup [Govania unica]